MGHLAVRTGSYAWGCDSAQDADGSRVLGPLLPGLGADRDGRPARAPPAPLPDHRLRRGPPQGPRGAARRARSRLSQKRHSDGHPERRPRRPRAGPSGRLLRHQPRPRLRGGARALRESAQRLLAAAARGAIHVAALRAERAVRAAEARGSASRTRRTARRRAPATSAARTSRAPRSASSGSRASCSRAGSASSARRRTAARSASGRSSACRSGRSATTQLFVLPSTSPANAAVPWLERLRWFRELAGRASGLPKRPSVRALVLDDAGRTLLFRYGNEYGMWWVTPGGGQEPGETDEQTLRRELREECGLDGLRDRPAALGRAKASASRSPATAAGRTACISCACRRSRTRRSSTSREEGSHEERWFTARRARGTADEARGSSRARPRRARQRTASGS